VDREEQVKGSKLRASYEERKRTGSSQKGAGQRIVRGKRRAKAVITAEKPNLTIKFARNEAGHNSFKGGRGQEAKP